MTRMEDLPTMKVSDLPFIISTSEGKADPTTRRFIRSHVMRGKNRIKPRRKIKTPLRQEFQDSFSADGWLNKNTLWSPKIPRLLCSKFAGTRFADEGSMEPARIADVLLFASNFSRAIFSLYPCITSKPVEINLTWFYPLLHDAAYLHAVSFAVQSYFDNLFARTRSAQARQTDYLHYGKALRMLQERLDSEDEALKLSDSTIMAILALYGQAYTVGNYASANHHINGVLKLVSLRGMETLLQNTKLSIEIIRSDLSMAIDGNLKPVLFAYDNVPWPLLLVPSVVNTEEHGERSSGEVGLMATLNQELAAVWATMSGFCNLVNAAIENGEKNLSEEAFLHSMGSIMYRLQLLSFEKGSLDEAFRFGLLAFSSPVFLHWNRDEWESTEFTAAYRENLIELTAGQANITVEERLWLTMIGALSMSHDPDGKAWLLSQLQEIIQLCDVSTWDSLRSLLSSYLWIGLLYDKAGKDIFDFVSYKS